MALPLLALLARVAPGANRRISWARVTNTLVRANLKPKPLSLILAYVVFCIEPHAGICCSDYTFINGIDILDPKTVSVPETQVFFNGF